MKKYQNIVTKRGNRSGNLATKNMSRLCIGLHKVYLDQKAKGPVSSWKEKLPNSHTVGLNLTIDKHAENNQRVKNSSVMSEYTAYHLAYNLTKNPNMYMIGIVPQEPHRKLSDMGKKKLERMKRQKARLVVSE